MLNLPLLAMGAVGVVSVVGHLVGTRLAELVAAVEAGDLARARQVNESLLPVYTGIFRTQGVILTKAALRELGLPAGPVRPPLVDATPEQIAQLRADLAAGGVHLREAHTK
jgi:4-hydroxy-tetrahydrodipicolinate synthase